MSTTARGDARARDVREDEREKLNVRWWDDSRSFDAGGSERRIAVKFVSRHYIRETLLSPTITTIGVKSELTDNQMKIYGKGMFDASHKKINSINN